jgi:hypothetical protein
MSYQITIINNHQQKHITKLNKDNDNLPKTDVKN